MRQDTQAGVTLLEMLVVLTVLAVVAGSALTLLPIREPSAPDALALLADDLDRASGDNILHATGMMFAWSTEGYQITVGQQVVTRDLPSGAPLSTSSQSPFRVSALGVPLTFEPLRLMLPNGTLVFDGVTARMEAPDATF